MISPPTNTANTNQPGISPVKARPTLVPSDGMVMRAVFFALLGLTVVILYRDYEVMRANDANLPVAPGVEQPILPALPRLTTGTDVDEAGGGARQAPAVVADPNTLRQPLDIELVSGGVLRLTGSISPGSAALFAAETAERTEYIQTVELNSPGGSVTDALSISKAIRDAGWDTQVRSGSLCASSCPLILSGGVERLVGRQAAVGVHQVFTTQNDQRSNADSISGTQSLTAEITRHLQAMGVETQVWVHALETPPQYLYYFTPEELAEFKLATAMPAAL